MLVRVYITGFFSFGPDLLSGSPIELTNGKELIHDDLSRIAVYSNGENSAVTTAMIPSN